MEVKPTFAQVIKNQGFRFLWTNQVLVQLAYNTLNFALIIWVFKLVGSNLAVAALMLAVYLPSVIFGLFAGVVVDRIDRKKIILVIDLGLAISFLFFLFIKASYPLVLINTFLVNSLAQFFMPSESSAMPILVPKRLLFLANSLFTFTLYIAFMVGFTIGGPILNHFGINAIFIFGAGLLFIAFLLAQNLPPITTSYAGKISFKKLLGVAREETKETFRFINSKITVAAAIGLMSAVQGIIGVMAVLMPAYLERVLMIHATDASYFMVLPLGAGMVLGALMLGRLFNKTPRRSLVIPAIVVCGVAFVLFGVAPAIANFFNSSELTSYIIRPRYFFRAPSLSFWFGVMAFLVGISAVSIIIPCQTTLQEATNAKNRGKIFATLSVIMTAFSAVPVVLAGGLADMFGVKPILIGLGAIVFFIGAAVSSPNLFLTEKRVPNRLKEFLGTGHWES